MLHTLYGRAQQACSLDAWYVWRKVLLLSSSTEIAQYCAPHRLSICFDAMGFIYTTPPRVSPAFANECTFCFSPTLTGSRTIYSTRSAPKSKANASAAHDVNRYRRQRPRRVLAAKVERPGNLVPERCIEAAVRDVARDEPAADAVRVRLVHAVSRACISSGREGMEHARGLSQTARAQTRTRAPVARVRSRRS